MYKLATAALALIGLAVLSLIGMVGVASAADSAVPGDLLYRVDRGVEALGLKLALNEEVADQLANAYAKERMDEVMKLAERGDAQSITAALEILDEALVTPEALDALDAQDNGDDNDNDNEDNDNGGNDNGDNDNEDNDNGDNDNEDNDNGDNDNEDDGFKQPKNSPHCTGTASKHHPAGDKLAEAFDVDYEDVIGWFCQGYGFGEIALAYRMSQQSGTAVEELFALRGQGQGWGQIMKSLGLKGKSKQNLNGGANPNGNANGNGKTKTNQGKNNKNNKNKAKGKPPWVKP